MAEQKTVLVIDDEQQIVTLLESLLSAEGYEVLKAFDGEEGLEVLKSSKPHLILMDVNMPHVGGISFYHRLASVLDKDRQVPVLVMSGEGGMESVFEGLQVEGFMTKPFEMDVLLAKVQEIMQRYASE